MRLGYHEGRLLGRTICLPQLKHGVRQVAIGDFSAKITNWKEPQRLFCRKEKGLNQSTAALAW